MNESNSLPISETADLFYSESSKLEKSVGLYLESHEGPSLSKIIELYYQVINVISLAKVLKQSLECLKDSEEKTLLHNKIKEMEKYIEVKFDSKLHFLIMATLEKSIENSKKKLKEITAIQNNKTKEDVENQAKMYEELRNIMSTREFVGQYNNELGNTI